jgi:hypothetical protein
MIITVGIALLLVFIGVAIGIIIIEWYCWKYPNTTGY